MLREIINKLIQPTGYSLIKHAQLKSDPLTHLFKTLANLNLQPNSIIDIGANHGRWTRSAIKFFPKAQFLMVEPQERLRPYSEDLLAHDTVRWMTAGISDTCGEMELTLPPRDDSASFSISEEKAKALGYDRIKVPVTTINSLVKETGTIPEMVKIDAEGFDLRALKGASETLGRIPVILVEMTVCASSWENTFEALLPFMWENGYRVFDITDLNYSPQQGVLWLTEMAFVHQSSPIWQSIGSY